MGRWWEGESLAGYLLYWPSPVLHSSPSTPCPGREETSWPSGFPLSLANQGDWQGIRGWEENQASSMLACCILFKSFFKNLQFLANGLIYTVLLWVPVALPKCKGAKKHIVANEILSGHYCPDYKTPAGTLFPQYQAKNVTHKLFPKTLMGKKTWAGL